MPASAPGPAAGSSSSAPAALLSELYQAGNSVLLHFHCGNVHLQQLDPVHCFPLLLLVKNKGWQGEEEQNQHFKPIEIDYTSVNILKAFLCSTFCVDS